MGMDIEPEVRFIGKVILFHRERGFLNPLNTVGTHGDMNAAVDDGRDVFQDWLFRSSFKRKEIKATLVVYRMTLEERYRANI